MMNIEKAQAYFQNIYNTHYPEKSTRKDGTWYYYQCHADHGVSGYEFDVDMDEDGLCFEYKIAADILGLPIVPLEKSPPSKPVPESEKTVLEKAWERQVAESLRAFVLINSLSTVKAPSGKTVTFQIHNSAKD
jgi:hypothetical protein